MSAAGLPPLLITTCPTYEVRRVEFQPQDPRNERPGFMQSMEDSRLCQLWLLTNIAAQGPEKGSDLRDVKNEECSSEFIENKGAKKAILRVC